MGELVEVGRAGDLVLLAFDQELLQQRGVGEEDEREVVADELEVGRHGGVEGDEGVEGELGEDELLRQRRSPRVGR